MYAYGHVHGMNTQKSEDNLPGLVLSYHEDPREWTHIRLGGKNYYPLSHFLGPVIISYRVGWGFLVFLTKIFIALPEKVEIIFCL